MIMRLVVLALLLSASASAQTSLADGAGAYASIAELDVRAGDGSTSADLAAGWRFASGADLGLSLDAHQWSEWESRLDLTVQGGQTWRVRPRVGLRLSGALGYGWRTGEGAGADPVSFDGAIVDAEASAFYDLPVIGTLSIQPTLGVFALRQGADGAERASGYGSPPELRDASGVAVGLPIMFRVLSADFAVAPTVRLGVGLRDHAFWGDGGMRLHVNL